MNDIGIPESSMSMSTSSKIRASGNQLVVVVSKAQDLPNRRKLDKQSPYCVARIQDQVQRTKIIPRGGQNPHFDEEFWFSLDNVEETTLTFYIYHQQKKDSELVCKAEIDFSPALRRSVKEGYDNWHSLEYNGKPAGRIFLEMTYYTAATSVPIQVENALRNSVGSTSKFSKSAMSQSRYKNEHQKQHFKPNMSLIAGINQDIPDLPNLEEQEKREREEKQRQIKEAEEDVKRQLNPVAEKNSHNGEKNGWMSKFMDNAYNFNINMPSFLNKGLFGSTIARGAVDTQKEDYDPYGLNLSKKDIPHRLFADSSDEEESDDEMIQQTKVDSPKVQAISSPRSNNKYDYHRRLDSGSDSDIASEDEREVDSFKIGQKVDFRSSTNSRSPLSMLNEDSDSEDEMESMRRDFSGKALPRVIDSPSRSNKENQHHRNQNHGYKNKNYKLMETPPKPPTHSIPLKATTISTNHNLHEHSLFDKPSLSSPRADKNKQLKDPFILQRQDSFDLMKTAPTPEEFRINLKRESNGGGLSYSQIRKQNLKGW